MNKGIYKITNLKNNKFYIGSTQRTFSKRWNDHKSLLKSNKHHSIILQRSWNKYGEDSFLFEILEEIDENIIEREQYYLDLLKPKYNVSPTAQSCKGIKKTKQQKDTLSKRMIGKFAGEKHHRFGKKVNKETSDKISKTLKRKYKSGEIIHPMLGTKMSKEQIAKNVEKAKGNSYRRDNPTYTDFVQINKETGEKLNIFRTVADVKEFLQIPIEKQKSFNGHLLRACREPHRTLAGFKWRFLKNLEVQVKSGELMENPEVDNHEPS